jgi:hypothetical protein
VAVCCVHRPWNRQETVLAPIRIVDVHQGRVLEVPGMARRDTGEPDGNDEKRETEPAPIIPDRPVERRVAIK